MSTTLSLLGGWLSGLPLAADADTGQVSLTPQTRALAALIALAFMAVILELIRRHRLQERYSVIWLGAGLAMLAGAAFPGLLEVIADLMGVRDTNVALFSLILLLLLGLAINFSVIISRQSEQITRLAQETAIQRAEMQRAASGGGATAPDGPVDLKAEAGETDPAGGDEPSEAAGTGEDDLA